MRTNYIVIHTAAWPGDSSIEDIRRVHVEENGWEEVGYHFLIRKDGRIETGRPITKVGSHCRASKMNYRSIGICCSGHGDQKPFTEEQRTSVAHVVNSFRKTMSIPIENIIGHREAGANKSCPGDKVDMDALRSFIDDKYEPVRLDSGLDDLSDLEVDTSELPEVEFETADGRRQTGDRKNLWERFKDGKIGRTFAGETFVGKALAPVKDVVLSLFPGGKYVDAATDEIGDQLKQNTNKSLNTMPEVKTKTSLGKWIKNRLREPSTYQGLAVAIGAIWGSVDPEAIQAIGTGVLSIIGGIQMIKKEKEDQDEESS